MKEMVNIIPLGSCPKCGHRQFLVSEIQHTAYITNSDGEIIDSHEIDYDAIGKCINCQSEFNMYPTKEGFVPLTRLREIMLDYTPHMLVQQEEIVNALPNPMEVNKNDR